MIKRTELQIGNIVLNGPAKAAILWEVIGLSADRIVLGSEFLDTHQELADDEDLYPVPIDPQLLKKLDFFFERRMDAFEGDGRVPIDTFTKRLKDFDIIITKDFDLNGIFYLRVRDLRKKDSITHEVMLQYVHELQNESFRFTNERLIISTKNG